MLNCNIASDSDSTALPTIVRNINEILGSVKRMDQQLRTVTMKVESISAQMNDLQSASADSTAAAPPPPPRGRQRKQSSLLAAMKLARYSSTPTYGKFMSIYLPSYRSSATLTSLLCYALVQAQNLRRRDLHGPKVLEQFTISPNPGCLLHVSEYTTTRLHFVGASVASASQGIANPT